ncbi:MAB_1171c family putative transporter [Streptomyces sp. NPDC050619]|uniref:MAB_1171c family putative transporter n=1 Tax=Streptomyces sp. NPDC050619 TaxID=3157214 RepID=UPI003414A341
MNHGPDSTAFYICGSLLLVICLLKVPALIHRRHDMLLRAACLLLFAGAWVFFLAAPESIAEINRLTGIPNVAAPIVYSVLATFGGASLLLIINWRPAPPETTRRASQVCITAYTLVVVAIIVLFWVGDAPVEQLTLFDGYYASTPYIREMILTYLIAQGAATMATSVLCWRWSTEVHGSLRAGLRILAPAYLLHVCYDVVKLIAIGARWTGHNLDFLIDQVAPQLAAPSALLAVTGFFLPLAGPRIAQTTQAMRQLRQLAPLWRELLHVPTPGAIRALPPWWSAPAMHLTGRKTLIYDALLALAPYYDAMVHAQAHRSALEQGEDERTAAITADAAMIVAATAQQARTSPDLAQAADTQEWRSHDLIRLSEALASPVVSGIRRHHGASAESSSHE